MKKSQEQARNRLDILLTQMKECYPDVQLSFGYIGNCGECFDDRFWMFFTKVRPIGESNCLSFRHAATHSQLESLADFAETHLDLWLEEQVQPHVKDVYRDYRIIVDHAAFDAVERVIEQEMGLRCGRKGGGRFEFSAQWLTVDTLNDALGHLAEQCKVEQIAAI